VITLDEALGKIEAGEFETVLEKDQATFPDNRSVWLLDLASLLNLRLECVPETDPVFEGKPPDYPLCLMGKKVRGILNTTLSQCSSPTLVTFAEHCMQSLISDMSKGIPTYGYRLFLQLLAHTKPDVLLSSLPKYLELVQSNKNRPLRCLAIMWAVGQVGVRDLSKGLKVWLELMLPVLNCRALSSYGVSYLDQLFSIHSNQKTANGVIGFKNFFPILDHVYSQQSAVSAQLQKKLLNLYPRIKTISFGPQPTTNLRNFFPSFLARLTPHCPNNLKQEVLVSLVKCLAEDRQCWSVWRQMYDKHLYQSSVLLAHLVACWPRLQRRLDQGALRDTVGAFSVTNEQLAAAGSTAYDGYHAANHACQQLLEKMTHRFPWRTLLTVICALLAVALTADVLTSKNGFSGSRSMRLLHDSGLCCAMNQAIKRAKQYTTLTVRWLSDNLPVYWARLAAFLAPYLALCWEKLQALSAWLLLVTEPQRRYVQRKVPELLDYAQQKWPLIQSTLVHYADAAWLLIVHYFTIATDIITHYSLVTSNWLLENVFTGALAPENLQKTLSAGLLAVNGYVSSAATWAAQMAGVVDK